MAAVANLFLNEGKIKSYYYMKAKIYEEVLKCQNSNMSSKEKSGA
jgi:hypothetical protein